MTVISELVAVLGFKIEGEEKLKQFDKSLDKAEKSASALATKLTAIGVAAGAALAAGMAKLGVSVIQTSAKFEGYLTTLETIEGSADKAAASFDWISKMAVKTPFEMEELTQAFVRLKAYGIDPTNGTMLALGDTASGMGTTLMQAVEMFADASTMEFERLKAYGIKTKQLGDQVTFSWSKNGEDLTKTVKKNGEEVRAFLLDTLGGKFSGAMLRQSKTWNGMVSNLGDSWTMFQASIGNAGFFDAVKDRLANLLDIIGGLADDGTIARVAKTLSSGFVATIGVVEQVAKAAWDVGKAFFYVGDGILSAVASMSGLSKGMSAAGILGGGALASVTGRKALMAVAKKIPAVAALLALEDIMSGLRGEESLVGSTETGKQGLVDLQAAATDLAQAWHHLVSTLSGSEAEFENFGATIRDFFNWNPESTWIQILGTELEVFVADLRQALEEITNLIDGVRGAFESVQSGYNKIKSKLGFGGDNDASSNEAEPTNRVSVDPARYGAGSTSSDGSISARPGQGNAELSAALANMAANMARMSPENAAAAVTNDNRIANDNRQFPLSNNVTINQTVNGPTAAPGAAARATGQAVASGATQQTRIAQKPSVSGNGPQ